MIINNLNEDKKNKFEIISENLFGKKYNSKYQDSQHEGALKFSNASLSEEVSNYLKRLVEDKKIDNSEVINSLTDIRYFTKIDNKSGVAKKGSLRSARILNRNISFYSNIYVEKELEEDEVALLLCGIKSLRHLGSLRSRGKGLVKCTLLMDNNTSINNENYYIEKVVK